MEIDIAIIEDCDEWAKKIGKMVQRSLQKENAKIEIYASAEEFLNAHKKYQIIFMDIYLKNMNGLEAAEKYKQLFSNCVIMIITSSKEFYKEGYKIEAFRYIEKNNLKEDLKEGLEHALIRLERYKTMDIDVPEMGKVRLIYHDIIYIESIKRKVIFHTANGNYTTDKKISELAEMLKEYGFYRNDKSFLVNLDWIDKTIFEKIGNIRKIMLKNGENIPLALKKKKELLIKLSEWRLKMLNR